LLAEEEMEKKKEKTAPQIKKKEKEHGGIAVTNKKNIIAEFIKGHNNFGYFKKKYGVSKNFVIGTIFEYKINLNTDHPLESARKDPNKPEHDWIIKFYD
jgi:hypothetical protein